MKFILEQKQTIIDQKVKENLDQCEKLKEMAKSLSDNQVKYLEVKKSLEIKSKELEVES